MELELDKNCFIAPELKHARALGRMLQSQGDMRGIFIDDQNKTLVIFDSYGNTHYSAAMQLRCRIVDSLIFRINGEIYIDSAFRNSYECRRHPLEKAFDTETCELFYRLYAAIGIGRENIHVTCWD